MTDDGLFSGWSSWNTSRDWDAMNKRISEMDEPDYTLKPSHSFISRTPKFSEWYQMPVQEQPPQIEGKRRSYDVKLNAAFSGQDLLGNNYQQIQAEINGRRVIVNKYEDGTYAVKHGNHVYRANENNLDDVIDECVE